MTPNINFYIRSAYLRDNIKVGTIECRITWAKEPQGFFISTKQVCAVNDLVNNKVKDENIQKKLDEITFFVKKLFENATYLRKELSKEEVKKEIKNFINPNSEKGEAKKKYNRPQGERGYDYYKGRPDVLNSMGNQTLSK